MRVIFFWIIISTLTGCSPVSKQSLNKFFDETEIRFQDHTGFVLYDPVLKKTIYSHDGEKYFTPASNTKLFTFFTALTLLGDSVPALTYIERGDSLIVWGTGDPSFLYPKVFSNSRTLDFLKQSSKDIYLVTDNFFTRPLGPGWAWEDYAYSYSVERSAFPVYGNYFTVKRSASKNLKVTPPFFKKYFWLADSLPSSDVIREIGSNRIEYYPGHVIEENEQWEIPFKSSALLVTELLADSVKKRVTPAFTLLTSSQKRVLYSMPADSLYRVMMQESDNFIAEQLLLVCSGVLSDSLKPEIAIDFMMKNHLSDLPDKPVWLDGSGLSRYNLFTPRSIVKLLEKIYGKMDRDRLFNLLAIGGKTGTLKNWYQKDPPYIFAKSGTLSNNHSLSGFLVTAKGRTLIFSFMSNNYTTSVNDVRREMQRILVQIHDNY